MIHSTPSVINIGVMTVEGILPQLSQQPPSDAGTAPRTSSRIADPLLWGSVSRDAETVVGTSRERGEQREAERANRAKKDMPDKSMLLSDVRVRADGSAAYLVQPLDQNEQKSAEVVAGYVKPKPQPPTRPQTERTPRQRNADASKRGSKLPVNVERQVDSHRMREAKEQPNDFDNGPALGRVYLVKGHGVPIEENVRVSTAPIERRIEGKRSYYWRETDEEIIRKEKAYLDRKRADNDVVIELEQRRMQQNQERGSSPPKGVRQKSPSRTDKSNGLAGVTVKQTEPVSGPRSETILQLLSNWTQQIGHQDTKEIISIKNLVRQLRIELLREKKETEDTIQSKASQLAASWRSDYENSIINANTKMQAAENAKKEAQQFKPELARAERRLHTLMDENERMRAELRTLRREKEDLERNMRSIVAGQGHIPRTSSTSPRPLSRMLRPGSSMSPTRGGSREVADNDTLVMSGLSSTLMKDDPNANVLATGGSPTKHVKKDDAASLNDGETRHIVNSLVHNLENPGVSTSQLSVSIERLSEMAAVKFAYVARYIQDGGALPVMVRAIAPGYQGDIDSAVLRRQILRLFSIVCADITNAEMVTDLHAVPHVARSITSEDAQTRHFALRVMNHLCAIDRNPMQFIKQNVIEEVINILRRKKTPLDVKRDAAISVRKLLDNDVAKSQFMEHSGIGLLVEMLNSPDAITRRESIRVVSLFCASKSSRKEVAIIGGVRRILSCIQTEDWETMRMATLALSYLTLPDEYQSEVRECGGVYLLVKAASSPDLETKQHAFRSLSALLCEVSSKLDFKSKGGVAVAISAMKLENVVAKRLAVRCLASTYAKVDVTTDVLSSNGMLPIINCVESNDSDTFHEGLATLVFALKNDQAVGSFLLNGGIEALMLACKSTALENIPVRMGLIECLSSLGYNKEGIEDLAKHPDIVDVVSRFLDSESDAMVTKAVALLRILAQTGRHNKAMGHQDTIRRLLSTSNRTKLDANSNGSALEAICLAVEKDRSIGGTVRGLNGFKLLIEKCESGATTPVRRAALRLMYQLLQEPGNMNEFARMGALSWLSRAPFNTEDPETKLAALRCLEIFSQDDENRSQLMQMGVTDRIVGNLNAHDVNVRQLSAKVLESLSERWANAADITNAKGVYMLLPNLRSDDIHTVRHCISTIHNLAATLDDISVLNPGMRSIVELLASKDMETRRKAAETILKIASMDMNNVTLRNAGAVQNLVATLPTTDVELNCIALKALATLCQHRKNVEQMLRQPCIQVLHALKSDLEESRDNAAQILAAVAEDNGAKEDIKKYEGISLLARLARDTSNMDTLRGCAKVFAELSDNEVFRTPMRLSNVPTIMFKSLSMKDPDTLRSTLRCLANMSDNLAVQEEAREEHGLEDVLRHCRSQDSMIARHAGNALRALCADPINKQLIERFKMNRAAADEIEAMDATGKKTFGDNLLYNNTMPMD